MKQFYFRLQKVLDVNEIHEEHARKRYSDAERARGLQNDKVGEAESAASSQRDEFGRALTTGVKAGEAVLNHRYSIQLQRNAREAKEKLKHLSEVSSDRRKDLTEAAKRKKMLEILKDKELEKYRQEMTIRESNEQDEIAGRRHNSEFLNKEIDA